MTNLRVGAFLLVLTAASLGFAQNATNRINSIKAVGNTVELEFTSPQEFAARDELIQVHIGDQVFSNTRSPEGGSLNTLIVSIPANDFANGVKSGDPVWIAFRGQEAFGLRWEFGKLNKKQLGGKK